MNAAIIVAAGSGTRMGPGVDKLFLPLAGQPVVLHAWRQFDASPWVQQIIVVVRDGQQARFQALAAEASLGKPFQVVAGGAERQDSVANGLAALHPEVELVAIHDGARPCVTLELIEATFKAAAVHGAAVAAQKVTDTLKEADAKGFIRRTVDRTHLWAVQTPQTFRVEVIRRALGAARQRGLNLTDDTAACELIGQPVVLVPSPMPNPKMTYPADLLYAERLLR
ncbi:2-C-methyl-D-erythritol 4-phosphate cytidylyltransferase [Fontisphaera persica]|uniref:2-C-methyl-D-erythritol 4-phosphate cytidylyltransferase n=1 Tax=Fontisphaera persica TaxID=2974023 RepID=UPI0024BF42FA|nr:2-C-methyl-D-erythritol 4-phosphate cytidylyltransferase [Fontisphaera persica]WCJ61016.1 2-C-methyl-D-erythritol 4-phosphate cytidylyltransferase [Fontisphaera persica]